MLTAVPRTDHLWLAREAPQRDPAARYVQEREGELRVWVGVLFGLGHFSPSSAGIGAMDNDSIHSTWMILGANGPHFATTDDLNLSEPSGDLAPEAFTHTPGQREGSVYRLLVLPIPDRNKLCQHEHHRYRLFHPSVPQTQRTMLRLLTRQLVSERNNWLRTNRETCAVSTEVGQPFVLLFDDKVCYRLRAEAVSARVDE